VSARSVGRFVAVCCLLAGLAVMHILPGMRACPLTMPAAAAMGGGTDSLMMQPALARTSMKPAATHPAPTVPLAVPPAATRPKRPGEWAEPPVAEGGRLAKPAARGGGVGQGWSGAMTMSGSLCLATPPSPGLSGLLALLAGGSLALLASAMPAAGIQRVRGPRRRGPPRSGALLLCDLCVSRT